MARHHSTLAFGQVDQHRWVYLFPRRSAERPLTIPVRERGDFSSIYVRGGKDWPSPSLFPRGVVYPLFVLVHCKGCPALSVPDPCRGGLTLPVPVPCRSDLALSVPVACRSRLALSLNVLHRNGQVVWPFPSLFPAGVV